MEPFILVNGDNASNGIVKLLFIIIASHAHLF